VIPNISNQSKVDAFGLFTGQIGYAWNNVLLYVKGGAAVTDNQYSSLSNISGNELSSANDIRWGGAIGVGFEYGVAPNWSMGLEYDHLFMGTGNNAFIGLTPTNLGVNTRNEDISQDIDLVTARINYRFGDTAGGRY
jgi:outer membrane immunogenic protein